MASYPSSGRSEPERGADAMFAEIPMRARALTLPVACSLTQPTGSAGEPHLGAAGKLNVRFQRCESLAKIHGWRALAALAPPLVQRNAHDSDPHHRDDSKCRLALVGPDCPQPFKEVLLQYDPDVLPSPAKCLARTHQVLNCNRILTIELQGQPRQLRAYCIEGSHLR